MTLFRSIGRSLAKLLLLGFALVVPFFGMIYGPKAAIVAFLVVAVVAIAIKFAERLIRAKKIS